MNDDDIALRNLDLAIQAVKEFGAEDAWKHIDYAHKNEPDKFLKCFSVDCFNPTNGCIYRRRKRTYLVNGIECPAPLTYIPKDGVRVYIVAPYNVKGYDYILWKNTEHNKTRLKAGCMFSTPEDAIENAFAIWPKLKPTN